MQDTTNYILIKTRYTSRLVNDNGEIKDLSKLNDVLRDHSCVEVAFISDDKIWGKGVIRVYNDSSDVREIINMGCAYTDGSICFKAPPNLTLKLYRLLRDLEYCAIYDVNSTETHSLTSGATLNYLIVDSESG